MTVSYPLPSSLLQLPLRGPIRFKYRRSYQVLMRFPIKVSSISLLLIKILIKDEFYKLSIHSKLSSYVFILDYYYFSLVLQKFLIIAVTYLNQVLISYSHWHASYMVFRFSWLCNIFFCSLSVELKICVLSTHRLSRLSRKSLKLNVHRFKYSILLF